MALSKKFLEPTAPREPPPPVRTKEPEQMGERRVVFERAGAVADPDGALSHPRCARSRHACAASDLDRSFSSGQSSRLYKKLVDSQLAISAAGGPRQALDPTIFSFNIRPRTGVDPAATEKVLYDELAKLQSEPVPDAELRKAKNQELAGFYRRLKTIENRANLLGTYEVFEGDYSKAFDEDKRVEAVSAADIQRVAKKYFTAKNRTVATLIPEKPEVKP